MVHRQATTRSPRDESVRLADWKRVWHDSLEGCLPAVNAYERFFRPLLFSINPETAHHLTIALLRRASQVDLVLRALASFEPPPKPKAVFGLTFRNPIGLAGGFDKNGVALPALAALGFGFIEVGTVTAKPQPGNPKPRIFRFPEQAALINRLGFNNQGADAIARRLRKLHTSGRWPAVPIGINIGKSSTTPLEGATDDYLHHRRQPPQEAPAVAVIGPYKDPSSFIS